MLTICLTAGFPASLLPLSLLLLLAPSLHVSASLYYCNSTNFRPASALPRLQLPISYTLPAWTLWRCAFTSPLNFSLVCIARSYAHYLPTTTHLPAPDALPRLPLHHWPLPTSLREPGRMGCNCNDIRAELVRCRVSLHMVPHTTHAHGVGGGTRSPAAPAYTLLHTCQPLRRH